MTQELISNMKFLSKICESELLVHDMVSYKTMMILHCALNERVPDRSSYRLLGLGCAYNAKYHNQLLDLSSVLFIHKTGHLLIK